MRTAGFNRALDVPMLIPHCDKSPGDMFALVWTLYSHLTLCRAIARSTSPSSLHVVGRRRRAAEKPGGSATFAEQEKRNGLAKASAAAAAAESTPVPTLIMRPPARRFDRYAAPEQLPKSFSRRFLSELPSTRIAALGPLLAGSFESSATAYGLTKLLL
jgi:hypothetical protein